MTDDSWKYQHQVNLIKDLLQGLDDPATEFQEVHDMLEEGGFSLQGFSRLRKRKGQELDKMINWQSTQVTTSLLKFDKKCANKESIKEESKDLFLNILGAMLQNQEVEHPYPETLAHQLIVRGCQDSALSDEICAQCIKQTTNNPDTTECILGWKLIWLCLWSFRPSFEMLLLLGAHMASIISNSDIAEKLAELEVGGDVSSQRHFTTIPSAAMQCYEMWVDTVLKGPKPQAVSIAQISAIMDFENEDVKNIPDNDVLLYIQTLPPDFMTETQRKERQQQIAPDDVLPRIGQTVGSYGRNGMTRSKVRKEHAPEILNWAISTATHDPIIKVVCLSSTDPDAGDVADSDGLERTLRIDLARMSVNMQAPTQQERDDWADGINNLLETRRRQAKLHKDMIKKRKEEKRTAKAKKKAKKDKKKGDKAGKSSKSSKTDSKAEKTSSSKSSKTDSKADKTKSSKSSKTDSKADKTKSSKSKKRQGLVVVVERQNRKIQQAGQGQD